MVSWWKQEIPSLSFESGCGRGREFGACEIATCWGFRGAFHLAFFRGWKQGSKRHDVCFTCSCRGRGVGGKWSEKQAPARPVIGTWFISLRRARDQRAIMRFINKNVDAQPDCKRQFWFFIEDFTHQMVRGGEKTARIPNWVLRADWEWISSPRRSVRSFEQRKREISFLSLIRHFLPGRAQSALFCDRSSPGPRAACLFTRWLLLIASANPQMRKVVDILCNSDYLDSSNPKWAGPRARCIDSWSNFSEFYLPGSKHAFLFPTAADYALESNDLWLVIVNQNLGNLCRNQNGNVADGIPRDFSCLLKEINGFVSLTLWRRILYFFSSF